MVEVELIAAGLLDRQRDADGRETLRVSDAGLAVIAATLQTNRAVRDRHEALVTRVALQLQRAGRIAWRGLSLRALVADAMHADGRRWQTAMPDVFSVRHTSVAAYLHSAVHEIKVRRADLLSDLRNAAKGAAYLALGSQCWYVLKRGIAQAEEVPAAYGVMFADAAGMEVARPAPRRAMRVPFAVWMALARAQAECDESGQAQGLLGSVDEP